ncbi:MAG: hypothetical protein ACQESF_01630 [Nanobdellota archaeon]
MTAKKKKKVDDYAFQAPDSGEIYEAISSRNPELCHEILDYYDVDDVPLLDEIIEREEADRLSMNVFLGDSSLGRRDYKETTNHSTFRNRKKIYPMQNRPITQVYLKSLSKYDDFFDYVNVNAPDGEHKKEEKVSVAKVKNLVSSEEISEVERMAYVYAINTNPSKFKEKNKQNHLLKLAYNGIHNASDVPKEILDNMNAFEIITMYAGIFQRKYIPQHEFNNHENLTDKWFLKESRLKKYKKTENNLFNIVDYLVTQKKLSEITGQYRDEWEMYHNDQSGNFEAKRYKKLNPYHPDTLKDRLMDIERKNPEAVEAFKKQLEEPFVPEIKPVKVDRYGNVMKKSTDIGFRTPEPVYRRKDSSGGYVKGRFNRIDDYAKEVAYHLKNK